VRVTLLTIIVIVVIIKSITIIMQFIQQHKLVVSSW